MRIRQVRREFWTDRLMASIPKSTRLFYIGLWAVADDEGYLRSDLGEIAGQLFPYEGVKKRETEAVRDWQRLAEIGRVVVLECQRHAQVPTLSEHQRLGGDKSFASRDEHRSECLQSPTESPLRSNLESSASNGRERKDKGGVGGTAAAPNGAARGGLPFKFSDVVASKKPS